MMEKYFNDQKLRDKTKKSIAASDDRKHQNTQWQRKRRLDRSFRDQEQLRDTLAKRQKRQSPNCLEDERSYNTQFRQDK